jgi:hypothetical protein
MFNNFFLPPLENRAVYEIMWKNMPPMGDSPDTTQKQRTNQNIMKSGKTCITIFHHSLGETEETH